MAHDPSPVIPPGPVLVGREREQAVLRGWLADTLAGHGRVVLIAGEAGIGKTTLVEDLARAARKEDAVVLTGRCYDLRVTPPYGPWVELARRYRHDGNLPAIPAFLHDAQALASLGSQEQLFAEVTAFVGDLAAHRPVVVILDDVHWADPGSLELLRYLAREVGEHRLLLLVSYRSDELTRRHPLARLVPLLVREAQAERLSLGPLDRDAIATLVAARYRLVDADQARLATWLAQRSEGNPLYLREILRSLEEDRVLARRDDHWFVGELTQLLVPSFVQDVIEARLARLGDEARAHLEIAAVIGQEVPIDLWFELSGAHVSALADTLERARTAHIIEEVPAGAAVRFSHALVRETLYLSMVALRRYTLHRRIGDLVASRAHADPDIVATHYQQGNDPRAVLWLIRAGERAQQAYAWSTAVERFEAALKLVDAAGGEPRERSWLLYRIARLERFRRIREASAYLDEVLRLAAEIGDQALTAAARFSHGECRHLLGDLVVAIEELSTGTDLLEALPPAEQERLDLGPDEQGLPRITSPRGRLVFALFTAGHLDEALRMGVAMGVALRAESPKPTPFGELGWAQHGDRYFGMGGAAVLLGRVEEGRAWCEQACRIYAANNQFYSQAIAAQYLVQLAALPYATEDLAELERLAVESEAARARAAGTTVAIRPGVAQVPILALTGQWDAAVSEAEAPLPVLRDSGIRSGASHMLCHHVLGAIAQARGQFEEAWSHVHALVPSGTATEPGTELFWAVLEGQRLAVGVALDAGDLPLAQEWLAAHERWLAWSGAVLGCAEAATLQARVHRAAGELPLARETAEDAIRQARSPRQPLALLTALRLLGEIETAGGRQADAEAHLREALALALACHAPYEQAVTLVALAELQAASSPTAALTTLAQACEIGEHLGASPLLARIDAIAARLTPAKRQAHPMGLTPREVEVLRLVAEDLTDAAVAERLFLSPRTVSQHLRSVYNKLGVNSRGAAIRFAVEHGLV